MPIELARSDLERLVMKNGGRLDFWIRNLALVESYIKKFDLKPIDRQLAMEPTTKAGIAPELLEWIDPRGGKRIPHFHFRGQIYLLDMEQWNVFTRHVMTEYRERLSAARAVSFSQFAEVSEAMESLPVGRHVGVAV